MKITISGNVRRARLRYFGLESGLGLKSHLVRVRVRVRTQVASSFVRVRVRTQVASRNL